MLIDKNEIYNSGNINFKNYIKFSIEEKKKILEFRNHIFIREMMHNKNIIELEDHLNFIDKLNFDTKNFYWGVIRKGKLIGSIYINDVDVQEEKAFWGVFLDPNYVGSGIGFEIQFEALNLFFKTFGLKKIFGEVFKKNKDSLSIQSKFLFKTKENHEKHLLLELNAKDWKIFSKFNFKEFKRKIIIK